MPYIVTDTHSKGDVEKLAKIDHDYDYPDGLNLKPGSKLHKKIVDRVLTKANESHAVMSKRYDAWRQMDQSLTAFIDLDDAEVLIKEKDPRKPVSIVYPYSYAVLETMLSYMVAAFFQEPIFRYEGVSPEDVIGAILLEKSIDLQMNKSKALLSLHTQFRDGFVYGFGVSAPVWVRTMGQKVMKKETGFFSNITNMFKNTGYEKVMEEAVLFEGHEILNIDPYLSLPDPNVPMHELQNGAYFGWVEKTNYFKLLRTEKTDGSYFNVKYLEALGNTKISLFANDHSGRNDKASDGTQRRNYQGNWVGGTVNRNSTEGKPVDIIHMYVDLIPSDWGLGSGKYPEKWLFSVAGDSVVIRAQPLGLTHGRFPLSVAAPDFDGYSATPISRVETLFGLQGTLDWMFNAHVANVRKAINDMFVYDPYLVNSKDLEKPGPGKLIRLRRPAWGRGVKDVVAQLATSDITRGHVADAGFIIDGMHKVAGIDSASMGTLRLGGPERLTGAEFKGTQQGKFSRMERVARVLGLQCMQDLGYLIASQTQQLMSEELFVKANGRWQEDLIKEFGLMDPEKRGRIKVSPFDILVDWDLLVRDGSVPGGNYSEVWVKMFEILSKTPELAQQFEMGRIFKHIARNNGAKNVEEFVKVRTMEDQSAQTQAQAGNLVPFKEVSNG